MTRAEDGKGGRQSPQSPQSHWGQVQQLGTSLILSPVKAQTPTIFAPKLYLILWPEPPMEGNFRDLLKNLAL